MFGSLIDIRDAPAICSVLNEKIMEHIFECRVCRPGVRCVKYVSLTEIRDRLYKEACRQQGIEFSQRHRALGDTLATLALIRKIAELGEKAPTYATRERDPWE